MTGDTGPGAPAAAMGSQKTPDGHRPLGSLLVWAVVFADIGTSVYYTPGILFGQVGSRAALFVVLTLGVFVLLTVKYAEVAIRYPEGGGVVTVASSAIHPYAGLLGGLLILVDYFLTASLSALSGLIYLTVVAGPIRPLVLPATIAALIVLGLLNLVGVSASAAVTAAFAVIAGLGQLAVVAAVAIHLGPGGVVNSLNGLFAGPRLGPLGLLTGFAGAFLAFSGLESIAQLAPSMAEPRKRVAPIAMALVVGSIALTSPLLTLWSTTLLNAGKADPNQFVSLLGGFAAGPWLEVSVALSGSLLLVFASNTALIGTYNVFLALARMRFLPKALTSTNRWRGTPHWAVIVATVIPAGVVVLTAGNVGLLGDLYAFGLLGAFSLTCISLDLVRFHERGEPDRSGPQAVNVGKVRFVLGLMTTVLVTLAWVTNLFAKPLATLFGGGVVLVGLALALISHRIQTRGRPQVFAHLHRPHHPIVLIQGGRRLSGTHLLVLLPHDAERAAQLARRALEQSEGAPVTFLYLGHERTANRPPPRLREITDPYLHDELAQEVFARAKIASRRAGVENRYVYAPAIAPQDTVSWVSAHLGAKQVLVSDRGDVAS
ncbi:MAG: hypothetical protein NVS9B1_22540 [Candidatus Dormibacteraceae bacterium]